MSSRTLCAYLFLAATTVLYGNEGRSASKPSSLRVEDNVHRLLATKSCPSCNLAGADLRQAKLNGANLEGANLAGARLSYADLSGVNLRKADLRGAHLDGADLSYADMDGANLADTIFERALFNATKIRGKVVNRLLHAEQPQLVQSEETAMLDSSVVVEIKTVETKGSGSIESRPQEQEQKQKQAVEVSSVQPAPFEEGSGQSSRLVLGPLQIKAGAFRAENEERDTEAVNAAKQAMLDRMFEQERCVGCDLSGVGLAGRDMEGFDLERVNFLDADLRGADLRGANLKGAFLYNAWLQDADLSGADLYRADCTGADLTGADLRQALVDGTDLGGAIGVTLEEAQGTPSP